MQIFKAKLNARGSSHLIVPLVVVVGIAVLGTYFIVSSHAATAKDCGSAPGSCGFPTSTSVGATSACANLTASKSITVSKGTVSNKCVSGTINVTGSNVVIKNTRVTVSSPNGWAIKVFPGAKNVTIENSTVSGAAGSSVEYAIFNQSDSSLVANHVSLTRCTECYYGGGTFENSYAIVNASHSGAHYEDVYFGGGSSDHLTVQNDTLFNQFQQTAAVYAAPDFGPVKNVIVTKSLLAGGGYVIYGANKVTSNVFSTKYFSKYGYYGVDAHLASGATWTGNKAGNTAGKTVGS